MTSHFLKLCFFAFALSIGFSSCQKQDRLLLNEPGLEKKGGDNDEPIILGIVMTEQQSPAYPALLKVWEQGGTSLVDQVNTDEGGNYCTQALEEGNYYIEVYVDDALAFTSPVLQVNERVEYDIDL